MSGELNLVRIEIPVCSTPVRFALDLSTPTQRSIYEEQNAGLLYEAVGVLTLSKFLKRGDVFIDVGSHVGYYSLIAAAMVGPEGAVIAFEPDNSNFRHLLGNARLNSSLAVKCFNMAVGDKDGTALLHFCAENDGGHALWDLHSGGLNRTTTQAKIEPQAVRIVSLDGVIQQLGLKHVTAIKIDVEGAELNVIEGAQKCLAAGGVDLIIIEFFSFGLKRMGRTPAQLIKRLYELGYCGYWSKDAETYLEITFDLKTFEPYGDWFEYHEKYIQNLFFVSKRLQFGDKQ